MSGTMVKSDKPIALYSGNICTNIKGKSRDHLVDQLLPDNLQGRSYIISPYPEYMSKGTAIKIVGKQI